jgi:hypothetical protein
VDNDKKPPANNSYTSPTSSGGGSSAGPQSLGSAAPSRLPGIGGLFADGIPKLKPTSGGVSTGRPALSGKIRTMTQFPVLFEMNLNKWRRIEVDRKLALKIKF